MKRVPIAFIFLLLSFAGLFGQPQTIYYRAWTQTGGTLGEDFVNHVATVTNASHQTYVASSTLNSGSTTTYCMLLSKYSSGGSLLWDETFTLNTAGNVHVGDVALDASGNVLVTGAAYNGSTNNYDVFVVKYNASGTQQWYHTYNGAGNSYDGGAALVCDTNDDVYLTGAAWESSVNVDIVTIRYNSSGTAQWTQLFNNASLTDAGITIGLRGSEAVVTGVSQTNLTTWEYATLGYAKSNGTLNSSYVTSAGGTTIDRAQAVAFDDAGNTYITGALGAGGQGLNIKTIKLDASLAIVWTATYNGSANLDDVGRGIAVDASGNVYVAGYTTAGGNNRNAILLKYSAGGSLSWSQVSDPEGGPDELADLALTAAGDVFVGGYVTQKGNKDFFAALYSSSGSLRWSDSYNGLFNHDDQGQQLSADGAGNFLLAGPSIEKDNDQTVLTIKYNEHTLVKPQDEEVNAPFVENRGQLLDTDGDPADGERYYTRSMYPNVYISDAGLSYVFAHIDTLPASQDTMARIDLSFYNVSPTNGRPTVAVPLERQEAHHNYYLGHIPEGRERVPLDNKVLHTNIYDDIDALYGQGQDGLFIRLICKPGSDPSDIKMAFTGQSSLAVQGDGSLLAATLLEDLSLPQPTASLIGSEGTETEITAWQPTFLIVSGKVTIGSIGSYDPNKTLVIKIGRGREEEPCLSYWSTYYGEAGHDIAIANDIDEHKNMYVTGITSSANFPVINAVQGQLNGGADIFFSKFSQPDMRVWSTFYGGQIDAPDFLSEPIEIGHDIKVDDAGNLYVVGRTTARDFPMVISGVYNDDNQYPGAWYSRGFIIRALQSFGTVSWSSYFGDSGRQVDVVTTVEPLPGGNIVIGGFFAGGAVTSTFPFTASGGAFQQTFGSAYVAELSGNNDVLWATKLTNDDTDQFFATTINDIAVDESNNLYLIGTIESDKTNDNIPYGNANNLQYGGYLDAFVMKFNSSRILVYSFFLGGESLDWGNSINCTENGYYVTGYTKSTDFPVLSVGDPNDVLYNDNSVESGDVFIAQFNFDGTQVWTRALGGQNDDRQPYAQRLCYSPICSTGGGAYIGEDGNLYVTGSATNTFPTYLPGGPYTPYYHQYINGFAGPGGGTDLTDAFLTIIETDDNRIIFSTYWGGYGDPSMYTGNDQGLSILASTDDMGNPIIFFCGYTTSLYPNNIPLCHQSDNPYFQTSNLGQIDGFLSKLVLYDVTKANAVNASEKFVSLFPNPTSSGITLKSINLKHDEDFVITIFDNLGKTMYKKEFDHYSSEQFFLDTSNYKPGIYLASIMSKQGNYSIKFIKI